MAVPSAPVVPEIVCVIECPEFGTSVTTWPDTGCPEASFRVTVIVAYEVPFAMTELTSLVTDEAGSLTVPPSNDTDAVPKTTLESEVSVAVYVMVSACVSVTVKMAMPLLSVVTGLTVGTEPPEPAVKVTLSPEIGLWPESKTLTTIVAVDVPSSRTVPLDGDTVTDEFVSETAPP